MKKALYVLVFFLLAGGLLVTWHYHPDIPLEPLKERYTYPESRFVSVDGMDVHYRVSGQGPDLLLIHGTGAGHVPMEEIPEETARDTRAFLLKE